MQAWLESIAGPEYASALMWTVFALIGLLVVLILVRIVRGLTFGTFVAGGRNRKARLAVMDATAVDSHRRLVLVRRDDVEHLILIGGPTDVVVEQNIRLVAHAPVKRPAGEDVSDAQPPQPVVAERPVPVAASAAAPVRQPVPPPAQPAPPRPAPQPISTAPRPVAEPRFSTMPAVAATPAPTVTPSVSPNPPAPRPAPSVAAPVAARPAPSPSLDDALLQELEVSLERDQMRPGGTTDKSVERTLDEEMSKLLGNLSSKR